MTGPTQTVESLAKKASTSYDWTSERDAGRFGAGRAPHPIPVEVVHDFLAQDVAEKQAAADKAAELDARFRSEGLRPRNGHTILGKAIEGIVKLGK